MKRNKPTVVIIGNLHSHPSAEAFLKKFLKIIVPLSEKVVLISGDLPMEFNGKVIWFKTELKHSSKFIRRIINYFFWQLRLLTFLIKILILYKCNISIFLGPHSFVILFLKFIGVKTIRYQGGSYSKQTFGDKINIKEYPLILLFETLPSALSDVIVIESRSCLEFQKLQKYRKKVFISPLYVDTRIFSYRNRIDGRSLSIGYISNLDKNKGAYEFLKTIEIIQNYIKDKNVKVIITGDGPLLPLFKKVIQANSLLRNVTFTGQLTHEEVSNSLNKLKLLIFPSRSEGLPNIVLEAISCGTPVLATSVGGVPDIIRDCETGFLLKSNDPRHIAERIVELLNKPNLLEKVSLDAYRYVNENFSYEKTLESWRKILGELY